MRSQPDATEKLFKENEEESKARYEGYKNCPKKRSFDFFTDKPYIPVAFGRRDIFVYKKRRALKKAPAFFLYFSAFRKRNGKNFKRFGCNND